MIPLVIGKIRQDIAVLESHVKAMGSLTGVYVCCSERYPICNHSTNTEQEGVEGIMLSNAGVEALDLIFP